MWSWKVLLMVCSLSLAQGQKFDRLYRHLRRRGAENTIPVKSSNDTSIVSLEMNLIQVTSLDPVSGDAEIDAWLAYEWKDERLAWEPDDFDGVTKIHMPSTKLWKPDILLYNGHLKAEVQNSIIASDGTVFSSPPTTMKTRCYINNYDSDGTVTCQFKFGSWTYDGYLLDLHFRSGEGADLSNFRADRWGLVNNTAMRNVIYYSCCPEPYPDLMFTLVFRDTHKESGSSKWSIFS